MKETTTVTEKIVQVPIEVATAVVHGAETVGHDVVKGATVVVDAAMTAGTDLETAAQTLGHDAKEVVSPPVAMPKPAGGAVEVAPAA
ncbi:MAG: hypothetical protein L3K11_07235 [Thermoplasmata archaeon]|nr:hypothetical protein [Thermoplasmata archaeon]